MKALATVGLAPFAPYHWLLYAESLWFDTTRAQDELGWQPEHSNASAVIESYEWFLAHRDALGGHARLAPPVAGQAGPAEGAEAPAVTERSEVQRHSRSIATKWRSGHRCARRVHQ